MTLNELTERLSARKIVDVECGDINEFYAGDFLSRVIGKAPHGSAWLTIMNNINVAGVAALAEIKVIVLCEGVEPAEILIEKCRENDIAIVATELDVFTACVRAGK